MATTFNLFDSWRDHVADPARAAAVSGTLKIAIFKAITIGTTEQGAWDFYDDLTPATTFGFVAQSAQLSLQNNLAAASFDLAALPVTNRLAVKMTTALLTFAAQPTQNLLRLGLTAASLRFVARAITVTGAISGAIKQFMTLMGVGK